MNFKSICTFTLLSLSALNTHALSYSVKSPLQRNDNPLSGKIIDALESKDNFEFMDLIDDFLSENPQALSKEGGANFIPMALGTVLDIDGIQFLLEDENLKEKYNIEPEESNSMALHHMLIDFAANYHIRDFNDQDRLDVVSAQLELVHDYYEKRAQVFEALIQYNDLKLTDMKVNRAELVDYALATDDLSLFNLIEKYDENFKVTNLMIEKAFHYKAINIIEKIKDQYTGNRKEMACKAEILERSMSLLPFTAMGFGFGGGLGGFGGFGNPENSYTTWSSFVTMHNGMPFIMVCPPGTKLIDHLKREARDPNTNQAKISFKANKATATDILNQL